VARDAAARALRAAVEADSRLATALGAWFLPERVRGGAGRDGGAVRPRRPAVGAGLAAERVRRLVRRRLWPGHADNHAREPHGVGSLRVKACKLMRVEAQGRPRWRSGRHSAAAYAAAVPFRGALKQ
jgi:hypothetical protein